MQLFVKTLTANTGKRDASYFLWVRACPISSASYVIANPILHIFRSHQGTVPLLVKAHTTLFPLDFYRGENCHRARTESKFPGIPSSLDLQHNIVTSGKADRCVSKKQLLCTDRLVSSNGKRSFLLVLFHCIEVSSFMSSFMLDNFREVYMCSSVKSIQNHSGFISMGV